MSDFFSAADMAEFEDVAASAMAGTLVIKRETRTGDGIGGFTTAFLPVGTVSCHIWRFRYGDEYVTGAQVQSRAQWYVAVPNGTDIREIDICDYNGTVTYQITSVPLGVTWNPQIQCEAVTYNRELRTN